MTGGFTDSCFPPRGLECVCVFLVGQDAKLSELLLEIGVSRGCQLPLPLGPSQGQSWKEPSVRVPRMLPIAVEATNLAEGLQGKMEPGTRVTSFHAPGSHAKGPKLTSKSSLARGLRGLHKGHPTIPALCKVLWEPGGTWQDQPGWRETFQRAPLAGRLCQHFPRRDESSVGIFTYAARMQFSTRR